MTTPGTQLRPFRQGAEPTTITPGSGAAADQHALIPLTEPASVGAPPFVPALVSAVTIESTTRRVRDAAGYTSSAPLDLAQRTRWTVAWSGLSLADRNELLAWLDQDVEHGLWSFTLEPDGPGTGDVEVRPVSLPVDRWIALVHYDVAVEVEEVFV